MVLSILVSGKMAQCTERVLTRFESGKGKETDMSENTGMELEVEKEFIIGLTVKGMLEISRMMCLKAREPINS